MRLPYLSDSLLQSLLFAHKMHEYNLIHDVISYMTFTLTFDAMKFIVMGRGTARSLDQTPNNATQTKQKEHKQK